MNLETKEGGTINSYYCYYFHSSKKLFLVLNFVFQSVADDEVFLPSDEIWVYDLEQGLW